MTLEEQVQHLQQRNLELETLVKALQAKERKVTQADRLAWMIALSFMNIATQDEINTELSKQSTILSHTYTEVQTALEELQIVEEELRQQNEELLHTRHTAELERQRYQTLFDFAPDGYLVTDAVGNIQEANLAIAEKLGIATQNLVGKPLSIYIAPSERRLFRTQLTHLSIASTRHNIYSSQIWHFTLHPRSGNPFPATLRVATRQEGGSRSLSLLWLICDITLFKQVETALRQSEERFRAIFERAAIGISLVDTNGQVLDCNPALQSMLGYSVEELRSMQLSDYTHPDDVEEDLNQYRSLLGGECHFYQLEKRYRCKNGQLLWGRLTVSAVRDEQQEPFFCFGIVEDITERKQFEAFLKQTNQELGTQVEAQTIELEEAIAELQTEASQRKEAETSLRLSEERYRSVVAALHEGLILVDAKGKVQACNASAERLLGISAADILHRKATAPLQTFLHEDGTAIPVDSLPVFVSLRTGMPCADVVMGIRQTDQSIVWLSVNTQPLFHAGESRPYAVVASFSEITQRKRAEAELRLQHKRSQLFADIALKIRQSLQPDQVLQTTVTEVRKLLNADRVLAYRLLPDGRGIVSTEATLPKWGSLLGVTYEPKVFPPESYPPYRQGKIRSIEDIEQDELASFCTDFLQAIGVRSKLVAPIVVQDELWGLLIAHQCGAPRQWSSFEIDLLKQLADQASIALAQSQLMAALRESEVRFRTMANSAPVLLWMCDRQQRNTFFNQSWLTFTGQLLEDEINHERQALIHPDDRQEWSDRYTTAFNTQQPFLCEYRMRRADGQYRWMLDTGIPRFSNGNFEGFIGSCIDITERKQVEDERRQAEAKTQKALTKERELRELKSRFVSTASHEFRTPLSTILSSADLLEFYVKRGIVEKQQEHIDRIQTAALLMTHLLNDVLIIEQAEAGKLKFEPAPIDLSQFLRELVAELELNDQYQHHFALQLCADDNRCSEASHTAWMDENLLRLIFSNLLFNAIKYSPVHTMIHVALTCTDHTATIAIRDQGIGISADDQARLFEPFHRGANVNDIAGTGLGLTIVRRSIEAHHGTIAIASEVGRGTIVTVTLPLRFVE